MDKDTVSGVIGGLIRHLITVFGGGLVAQGLVTASELDVIGGAIAIIAGVAWSVVAKKKTPVA